MKKNTESFYNIKKSIYALDGKIETPKKSLRKTCEMAWFPRQLVTVQPVAAAVRPATVRLYGAAADVVWCTSAKVSCLSPLQFRAVFLS